MNSASKNTATQRHKYTVMLCIFPSTVLLGVRVARERMRESEDLHVKRLRIGKEAHHNVDVYTLAMQIICNYS